MFSKHSLNLVKPGDAGLTFDNRNEDIRGRNVVDKTGKVIGHVKDVLLHGAHHKVRFVEIGHGGLLGLGEQRVLIPVEVITRVDTDAIRIDLAPDRKREGSTYDPAIIPDQNIQAGAFGYNDRTPFRGRDWIKPVYPRYPHDIR